MAEYLRRVAQVSDEPAVFALDAADQIEVIGKQILETISEET